MRRLSLRGKNGKKALFCGGMFLLLLLFVWVFYFQKKVIREEFELTVMENFDQNQNISTEPGPRIKEGMDSKSDDKKKGKEKTGLYLKSNSADDVMEYVNAMMYNVLQVNSAGQIPGKVGPKGMKGEAGANGGLYQRVGALHNLKYPDKYMSRAAGTGAGAVLYTQPYNGQQWQQWQMGTDNKLRSVFDTNQCIDQKDGKLMMNFCNRTDQTWRHNRQTGAIMSRNPIDGKPMCFSLKTVSSYPSNGPIEPGQKGNSGKNITNTDLIVLEECSNGKAEQTWQWR